MTFRDNPPSVERVLAAARRIDPAHSLYVTFEPESEDHRVLRNSLAALPEVHRTVEAQA